MRAALLGLTLLILLPLAGGCSAGSAPRAEEADDGGAGRTAEATNVERDDTEPVDAVARAAGETQIATLGAGCFWCIEAVLEQVPGVLDVRSGYMGGDVPEPTYAEVCSGRTGHAEVVEVAFDPERIGYAELLDWFFRLHDPTTLNRQGHDVGTQYRSVVFYHSEEQRLAAEAAKLRAQPGFDDPIVTEVAPAGPFYEAEPDHQDYYRANRAQPYCRAVIRPKLEKLGLEE